MPAVVDSSAVLAVIFNEPDSDAFLPLMHAGFISSVNLSEAVSKLSERGVSPDLAWAQLQDFRLNCVTFDSDQARSAGEMRASTRDLGLSLGDRACLALARQKGLPVLTTDRSMGEAKVGVEVQLLR